MVVEFMGNDTHKKSFWKTLPGVLTGIAAMITAIGGILTIIITSTSPAPLAINTFEATPEVINSGDYSILRWSVSGATSVTINQGIGTVQLTDSEEVWPTSDTTYTLTATNEAESVSDTATVEVIVTNTTLNLSFMIDESGWVTNYDHVGTGSAHHPMAGDFMNNEAVRGFLSFDLTGIPSNAIVQSARLIFQYQYIQGEPFPNFGSLKFEAVYYGLSLVPAAYDTLGYLVLQDSYGQPGDVIGVSAGVEEAVSQGYSRFQIRFSFSLGTDSDGDGDSYSPTFNRPPTLEVVYSLP